MATPWTLGAAGQPPQRVRQILLANGVALFGTAATTPYIVYYLTADAGYFLPIVFANAGFLLAYAGVLRLNAVARFDAARNLVLATVYAQLFAVTVLIGTGAGVDLFYFPLAAVLGMILVGRNELLVGGLVLLATALFLVCQLVFAPGDSVLEVPRAALHVMYVLTTLGAMLTAVTLPYLFRLQIDRAHAALEESNEELERLSGLDPVTGIPNRRALDAHLAREWSRARRERASISVLVCDVDHFKEYNDRYGHPAGDRCLERVADAIRGVAGRGGDFVGRYGGEEFVVVLPGADADGAARFGERVRAAVAALELPHESSDASTFVSVSVGVSSTVADPRCGPTELVRRADEAMYAAKLGGRNRVVASGSGYTRGVGVIDRGAA